MIEMADLCRKGSCVSSPQLARRESRRVKAMADKVLFVDDEPVLLQGYHRLLRKDYEISTAVGGGAALVLVQHEGPFGVVISDMRMPEMNGIEFLLKVRKAAPDTVRIMLTGNADLGTAIQAVNEGNIFRFLNKPCNKETLVTTINEIRIVASSRIANV